MAIAGNAFREYRGMFHVFADETVFTDSNQTECIVLYLILRTTVLPLFKWNASNTNPYSAKFLIYFSNVENIMEPVAMYLFGLFLDLYND